jgi:fumarate hydratase subunit alpha
MKKKSIDEGIIQLIRKAETELPNDVVDALTHASMLEEGLAKIQIETILKTIQLAKTSRRPMCQDTGIQTFFINIGADSPYLRSIKKLIVDGVKKATIEIPLRPNTVDPFTGKNHADNTGEHIPSLTLNICEGSDIHITALPKGGGSENMSKLGMLKPGVGIEGVKRFIVDEIVKAGGSPCPPTVVGVGIGGGADIAMKLASGNDIMIIRLPILKWNLSVESMKVASVQWVLGERPRCLMFISKKRIDIQPVSLSGLRCNAGQIGVHPW